MPAINLHPEYSNKLEIKYFTSPFPVSAWVKSCL
jgi:hypothetical protein